MSKTIAQELVALSGNEAVAYAFKQARPHVASAFPITPQTEMMHKFAEFVANGEATAEMILVESEHSAMSAAVGAAAAGARTITATSSAGFALMWEIVYVAASLRLPIQMALVNRALSGNINIHCDHSDSMGGRDAGWIHHFCENAQEAYDTALINFRISEHMDVRLPAMVNYDGFIVSHKEDALYLLDDGPAYDFIGPYRHKYTLLDPAHPITVGPLDLTDYYFEHKFTQLQAYPRVFDVAKDVFAEFGALTGRHYGLWEEYRLDDADLVMIVLGSSAGTAKDVIDEYREKGVKVGLLKLRMFRPFPAEQLRPVLAGRRAIAVLDRSASFGGWGGPVFNEVRSALYGNAKPAPIHNWLYGLGGRDFELGHAAEVIESLQKIAAGHELPTLNLLGCRA
ncbi:MAG TPA: pyruvate ferredoxin oxidoreductase [Candidatus Krumholzibacteria bacterium]|nr:pyruvate ferredoxin oxidoreductase [Candidatus Krumholzibacteria bacterium]HPD70933.1 pyruvate ferredoxin oxidoreductase [Candidatus Krumholzibacteria bacterium]HRY39367.1 pyruvate ferredoxin oxidoreductase [Candidatus Krumholzibacteria bacterium]